MMKIANIEVTLVDSCGSDISVVNAARVSFNKESEFDKEEYFSDKMTYHDGTPVTMYRDKLSDKDTKLITYLAKHKHTSPFNHAFLSFRVKAPIFVARQMVKHKFLPWNEVSRRYVDEEPEFYFPTVWRGKAVDKKQGSGDELNTKELYDEMMAFYNEESFRLYKYYLGMGVCPEQARMVLPQNVMTEWIWSGTLGAFCDMLRLRLSPDTQEETREVATLISKHVQQLFPVSYGALLND
jgi:thymidylate synthase (FAD)